MVGSVISEPPLNQTTLENSDQHQQSINQSGIRCVVGPGRYHELERPGAEKMAQYYNLFFVGMTKIKP